MASHALSYHPLVAPIVSRFPPDPKPDPPAEVTSMPPKESDRLYDLLVDNGDRLQKSIDTLSDKVDKQGNRTFLLSALLVLAMAATSGASLYIQWSRIDGLTVGTGPEGAAH